MSGKARRQKATQFILEDRLTPPTYQIELLCSALKHNTVLCVSNDAGLCFIPVMLMKLMTEQRKDKKTLYISPDGDAGLQSCKQNEKTLSHHSPFTVHRMTSQESVRDNIDQSHVICVQASQCVGMLQNGDIDFSCVNLMVFDDCHVAVEPGSLYAEIVSLLKNSQHYDDVRIFGMTSSIIGGLLEEPEELEKRISQLETVLCARAETMTDLNTMDSTQNKREEIVAIYDRSDESVVELSDNLQEEIIDEVALSEAESLTCAIRTTLQHAYHFLGDMIISQTDVVTSRTSMIVRKVKGKAIEPQTPEPSVTIPEPARESAEWSNMQMYKDIPRKVFTEVETTLDELGAWCAGCVALNLCSTLEKLIDKSTEKYEKLLLQLSFTHLKYIHTLVQQASERTMAHTELLAMSTPKVRKLIQILKSYLPKVDFEITSAIPSSSRSGSSGGGGGKELYSEEDYSDFSDLSEGEQEQEPVTVAKIKQEQSEIDKVVKVNQEETTLNGLVYVERKHSAFALHKYIEELCIWDCDMYFIRSSYMIGGTETDDGREDQQKSKKQEQRLMQFRQHKVNLLVGTSVLESNIDLPKCNLVAMFDPPQSYTSYIKTKSRARSFKAKYYTMCSEVQQEFFTKCMNNFNKIETILQSKCQEFTDRNSDTPLSEEANPDADDTVLLPAPFISPRTGATVTIDNSIGLLNRYCAKLPSDIFTRLTPTSTLTRTENGSFQATIKLPINCRLKRSITGDLMETEDLAIAAAALETCKELFNHGELDAHLAPIGKEYLRNPKQDAEWEGEGYNKQSKGLPGSSKRKQYYNKRTSQTLKERVSPDISCYLYTVDLNLEIAIDQQKTNKGRDIFRTELYPYTVGLITRQQLPPAAEFPVFTRSGQESVSLKLNQELLLTPAEFDKVTEYHSFVFHNVLRIDKFPLTLGTERSDFNVLVIPVTQGVIAWDYLDSTLQKMVSWSNRPPLFSRKSEDFEFVEEDFKDAVVVPTYRNQDQPEFFYVASIRRDLNPDAPFPSPDLYESFYSYYTSKYGLSITNKTQPLLDVDRTSGRLNLMTPRYMNQKGMPLPTSSTNKKTKKVSVRERQILIPELCDIHPCTASMWRKLVCVPTILHRINSLLLSYELVCFINTGMRLGWSTEHLVPEGDKLDLGVDVSLLQAPGDGSAPGVPVSSTGEDKPYGDKEVIDEKALIEELQDVFKDTLTMANGNPPKSAPVTTDPTDDIMTDDSEESDDNDSDDDDEDSDSDVDISADLSCDLQLDKEEHTTGTSGPTATMILHALTMSNASDFINLERLETVGDSFLKFAVTLYLFCTHPGLHEGRLSYGRGKQVSNFNLYYLGKKLGLQEYLLSEKFEPTENWLPPGYVISEDYEPIQEFKAETTPSKSGKSQRGKSPSLDRSKSSQRSPSSSKSNKQSNIMIPYNLRTQHSIPDKAIADCVESLIGCYLTSCGPYAARVFMAWLGINVLPERDNDADQPTTVLSDDHRFMLPRPPSALLNDSPESRLQLERLFSGLETLEESLNYKFRDKAYLVQAFTHASYIQNTVTDCYQRLEFLGDAVLDYVITRRLFEDHRKHTPGILTDLRSALVNNNVFAALAVKWNLHKYIKYNSAQLYSSVNKFVQHQKSRNDRIQVEQYLRLSDDGDDDSEEVEIPKVLGDIFESVAGAIYLDSNMSLDTVWRVYYKLMIQQIVKFSKHIPKSPVRELLEREPETAKFQKPERTKDGRVRVSVTVAGKDTWWGVGRSYRIAKAAAAKKALLALNQV